MDGNAPHFVLFSEASRGVEEPRGERSDGWRFILQTANGEDRFVASDMEPGTWGERLELLAVVRGLEALDQPSRVTLVTRSRYVSRGLRVGLTAWRESDWQWERFGKMVPVTNHDLWQRVDQALKFHRVECRRWRVDAAHRPKGAGDRPAGRHGRSRSSRHRGQSIRVSGHPQGGRWRRAASQGLRPLAAARLNWSVARVEAWWRRLIRRLGGRLQAAS